ncbi:hypothetical protein [Ktedonospora formicarum]|uniref:DUF2269 family protein n=1 Tax=Ktedonospora formicarum TaxID=2778364 RepID=A0A8J3I9D5_9CHLR|nr:hypothetical protein [Ktedonospora formicarum]GHO49846.1 hypothetical protein KSX_80090 [Ktedonospora formicarum]
MNIMLILVILRYVHISAGIIWLGDKISLLYIVYPLLIKGSADVGRTLSIKVPAITNRVGAVAGATLILAGILLGTFFGRIQSWERLIEPYGLAWMFSLLLTIVLAVVSETRRKMIGELWDEAGQVHTRAVSRLKMIRFWESLGFVLIISCMIFMHFN